jgi:outer membrane protein assembly factor BamB
MTAVSMLMTRRIMLAAGAAAATLMPAIAAAQAREWTTSGYDAQRSGWVRSDPRISKTAIEEGQFQFLWRHTFDNETRQLNGLTEPVLQDLLVGYRGFKSLAFLGASGDRIVAIDTDLARPYWTTHVTYAAATGGTPPSTWECPGGLMAAVSRRTPYTPQLFTGGGGGGRARARSAVGEPGKGAAILAERAAARAAAGRPTGDAPAPAATAATPVGRNDVAPPQRPVVRQIPPVAFGGVDPLYVMGSDGQLRTLRVTDGAAIAPPLTFIPPNARPTNLIWTDGVVYTTTSHGCGNAPSAVWAVDTVAETPAAITWDTGGPEIAGQAGVAFGSDGTVYVALGGAVRPNFGAGYTPNLTYANSVVALDRLTLKVKDWFTAEGADFNVTPTVIRHKGRDLIAVAGNDGRLYLLDGAKLGGADHRTPMHVAGPYSGPGAGGGLATFEHEEARLVLAPAVGPMRGGIVAFKVVDQGPGFALEQVWRSEKVHAPLAPIVVNGVVFAASSGEFRTPDPSVPAETRAQKSSPAVLYALDAATGRDLWSSGVTIESFARVGLAGGGGQVYVVTHDNTLYAFGIPLEH